MLIDSSFVATISIVQGDPNVGDEDDQDGVRHVAKRGGYYAANLPSAIVPSTQGTPEHPVRIAANFG